MGYGLKWNIIKIQIMGSYTDNSYMEIFLKKKICSILIITWFHIFIDQIHESSIFIVVAPALI